MVEAIFDWIIEMRAGNLGFIIEVPNISLPHLEAWSHIKAWSEKITFEIEARASIRGNTVFVFSLQVMREGGFSTPLCHCAIILRPKNPHKCTKTYLVGVQQLKYWQLDTYQMWLSCLLFPDHCPPSPICPS